MKHSSGFYPRVRVDAGGSGVVSHAGAAALTETVRAVGLDRALSGALGPWRKPFAAYDPAKILVVAPPARYPPRWRTRCRPTRRPSAGRRPLPPWPQADT